MNKTNLKKYVPLGFYVLIIIFLGVYLNSIDFSKFRDVHFVWGYLLVASVIGLMFRYWAVLTWLVILKSLGAESFKRHLRELTYVFAKSWMGRYIPGTAPWILGKIYFAAKLGISKKKLGVSSLLEGGLQIAVSLVVGFALLLLDSRFNVINFKLKIVLIIMLVGCVIAVLPPVFNRLVLLAYKLIRKKTLAREHLASNRTIASGSAVYVVAAILNGLSVFFITKSIYPSLAYHDVSFVIGAASLSGAAGMLAIFVPSGIGVRDGIFLALMSLVMPTELALVATIASRLWGVVLDIIFFGLSKLLVLPSSKSTTSASG